MVLCGNRKYRNGEKHREPAAMGGRPRGEIHLDINGDGAVGTGVPAPSFSQNSGINSNRFAGGSYMHAFWVATAVSAVL